MQSSSFLFNVKFVSAERPNTDANTVLVLVLEEQIPKLHDRRVTTYWRLAWLVSWAANHFHTCSMKQQNNCQGLTTNLLDRDCQYSGWPDVGLYRFIIYYSGIDIAGSSSGRRLSFFF